MFFMISRSPRAGTFAKDLTNGRGINEWQRSGLTNISKKIDFNNDPTPS